MRPATSLPRAAHPGAACPAGINTLRSCSRRDFLRVSAAAWATLSVVPGHVLGAAGQPTPNSRPQLAGVGVGGVGFGQLDECEKAGFRIIALCDVDDVYAKKAYDRWPQARRYRDFRELLQAEADRLDAVYVGTPDHTHALITLAALRRKKHVCCVKPLTRTAHEGRVLLDAARQSRVATQMTAAANTGEEACRTCEWIQGGAIGAVREVHVWSDRPLWPQGMTRPPGEDPLPATFDWKLWLGPAPMRPFKANWPDGHAALTALKSSPEWIAQYHGVYHPFNFRGWWDFGTGALGDMGCHHFNTILRALRLKSPKHVEATATKVFPESAPLASIVTYSFDARDGLPPVQVIWHDGGLKPARPAGLGDQPLPDEGTLYRGEQGVLLSSWSGPKLFPESIRSRAEGIRKTLTRRSGTWGEWFEACRGGEPAGCDFEWAVPLTELVLLGNIALRTGKRLEWDASQLRFLNETSANSFLKEPYHNGWSLDAI